MKPFELVNASSLSSALGALGQAKGAVAKAGGVDLLDLMKEGISAPPRLINLRTIAGLDKIAAASGEQGAVLGPLATLAQLAESKALAGVPAYAALAEAAAAAATPQIRNMATLAGNLCQRPRCWYFRDADYHCLRKGGNKCFAHSGDNAFHAIFENDKCAVVHPSAAAVALSALGAKLELQRAGKDGKVATRELAMADFFVAPSKDVQRENVLAAGELISAVKLPAPQAGQRSAYIKQKQKQSFDWPLGEVAVSLTVTAGKIAAASVVLGSVAPIPWRAKKAEAALVGKAADEALIKAAAEAALAGADPLDDNGYKVPLVKALVRRALTQALVSK
ncbi:MAG: FAD binding domain-containing protein [Myxococcales bacterium]|nr:FAD binding domain-containing protein [Myxococcales bacterium]